MQVSASKDITASSIFFSSAHHHSSSIHKAAKSKTMTTAASNTTSSTSSSSPPDNEGDVAVGAIAGAAGGGGGGGGNVISVVCPPNIQAILAQCTLSDQGIHSNINITNTEEEEQQHSHYYDCSHDSYLASLVPPGKYKNVTGTYLSHSPHLTTPHYLTRLQRFSNCTGGTIHIVSSTDISNDALVDLGSFTSIGTELYDAYLMQYSTSTEASFLGLLETLNERIKTIYNPLLLQYEDIFPKVRTMGEYRKGGKTRIELLMSDADFFVPLVRIDLLERDGKALPHTWEDLVRLVQFYNGTDLNDDGDASGDYGLCLYPRGGGSGISGGSRGFMKNGADDGAFIPELMYSTWASVDQTQGIQQGFFFDDIYFTPRIGNGFAYAMNIWKELWDYSADAGCDSLASMFMQGRCAIGYAPPGCWKDLFIDSNNGEGEGGVAWRNQTDGSILRDANSGKALWRPRMADGSYAEPYRLKPFGSLKVINRKTDEFEECAPNTCPRGERIPHPTRLPTDDRAGILVESSHVDQLINRVPFYWSGGYGNGIRKSADPVVKDMMWDFFVYVNSPITSVDDVILPSMLDSWRYSQLASYERNYEKGGWSYDAWNEHQKVVLWAMGNEVNSALTLRVPGVLTYTRDVVLPKFMEYMDGTMTIEDVKASVHKGWEDATTARGLLPQLCNYWFSLGVDGLSESELCRVHRRDMDMMDSTVCVKYDPKDTSSNTLLVAVLVPVLLLISAGIFVFLYIERKHRVGDLMWQIKKDEIKFDDPPEIAGRGTFGLVVMAEYRGTVVAVKRVIPPKHWEHRGVFSDYHLADDSSSSGECNKLHESVTVQKHTSTAIILDRIPDNEELDHCVNLADVEAGIAKPYNPHKRRPTVDSVSVLSSTIQTRSDNSSSAFSENNKKWTRFFGSRATAANYEQLKQDFVVEMRVLSKLRHPCITTVMGSVIDQREEPLLVMEYMENGSLYDLLHNDTMVMDGEVIFPILQDIARGARFLHAADPKVIHGDLKAANILVDGRFRAKIADFGLSAKKKCMGVSGTPYWMAPELLRKESINTAESDVYSFGIILFELYSRKDPYEGENPSVVLDGIVNKRINKRPPVPAGCPMRIADIMKECIDGNPEKRPSFEEIDVRIRRLDSENVAPGNVRFGHQKTQQQMRRASKEEDLIQQVFPKHVAQALIQGHKVEPDRADMASMYFSDIVGFTKIASIISPDQVSDMLDRLYLKFDELSVKHDVFKIETIGDAYVGICNLVENQEADHAKRITEFAIDTLKAAAETPVLSEDPSMGTVSIRVGIHCGPLVARVVGSRNPRYCVFGDTVNTTSRMESHSLPMKIHCSDRFEQVLKRQVPGTHLQPRGMIPIKGKGLMETFFINHEEYKAPELQMPASDEWQQFLSLVTPEVCEKNRSAGPPVSDEWQHFLSILQVEREPSQSQFCD